MMKIGTSVLLAGLAVCSFGVAGCDSQAQERQREVRDLAGFTGISASGGIDLDVQQGDVFHVEVAGNHLEDLLTEVRDSTLVIRHRRGSGLFNWWSADASASVTMPVVESLTASGGSDIVSQGELSGESLSLVASGGSDARISVAVTNLEIEVSGGSDVDLSGTAVSAALIASGGSDLNGRSFRAREVNVVSSGGSDAILGVDDRLTGSASGGSDIVYMGNPATVDVSTSGGSDIVRR